MTERTRRDINTEIAVAAKWNEAYYRLVSGS